MTLTKAKFRKNCLKKLSTLPCSSALYRNKIINKKLLKELHKRNNANILFYYPFGFEVDIREVITKMRQKSNVYIPFMQGESFKMVPFRLPLKKRKYGILEAGNTYRNINKIDIAIVPVVGVDGNLQRVGFGKGMYDRFFEKLKKRPYTIFIQADICHTKENICDSYDVSCDLLLTAKQRLEKRK